ncbi:hypothetical protein C8J56DRAFT_889139 [Mycena floridula]|nr:hypothetical protein C8J56DRAFT_889139 [Mycena floridula]
MTLLGIKEMTLVEVSDTVAVGGLPVPNIPLHLIQNQSMSGLDCGAHTENGILGLASSSGSLFEALIEQGLPHKSPVTLPSPCSNFLLPLTELEEGTEMMLGGIDNKFSSTMVFTRIKDLVNGWVNKVLNSTSHFFLDTGTPNAVLPLTLADASLDIAIYALISQEIQPNPDEPGAYGIACSEVVDLPAVVDITFT